MFIVLEIVLNMHLHEQVQLLYAFIYLRYKVTVVIFLLKSINVCPWGAIESCTVITARTKIFWPKHT